MPKLIYYRTYKTIQNSHNYEKNMQYEFYCKFLFSNLRVKIGRLLYVKQEKEKKYLKTSIKSRRVTKSTPVFIGSPTMAKKKTKFQKVARRDNENLNVNVT